MGCCEAETRDWYKTSNTILILKSILSKCWASPPTFHPCRGRQDKTGESPPGYHELELEGSCHLLDPAFSILLTQGGRVTPPKPRPTSGRAGTRIQIACLNRSTLVGRDSGPTAKVGGGRYPSVELATTSTLLDLLLRRAGPGNGLSPALLPALAPSREREGEGEGEGKEEEGEGERGADSSRLPYHIAVSYLICRSPVPGPLPLLFPGQICMVCIILLPAQPPSPDISVPYFPR